MRISDWSSDVCSSDLQHCEERRSIDPAARFERRWHLRRSNCLRGEPQRSLRVGAGWKSPLYRQSGCNCPLRLSAGRSEEHTSELQSLMRISYAVFCLKKKTISNHKGHHQLRAITYGRRYQKQGPRQASTHICTNMCNT